MIIDFNRYNGGGSGSGSTDLTNYWNSAVTEQHIESAASITYASAASYTDQTLADIDLSDYYTSAQTDDAIAQAVSGLASEEYVQDALSGVDLSNYYTSAQTEEAITSKNYITSAQAETQIASKNYVTSGQVKSQVEAYNYVTSGQVKTQVEDYHYVNSGDVQTQIDASVSGKADAKTIVDFDHTPQSERAALYASLKTLYDGGSGATINKNYDFYKTVNTWQGLKIDYYGFSADTMVFGKVVSPENTADQVVYEQVMTIDSAGSVNVVTNIVGGGGDMTGYWNSAETKTYVDSAITGLQNRIDEIDEVVSDALNDLNGELATKVSSTSVSTIWKGTQAQYDAIVTKDPATFYIIVNNN